MDFLKSFNYNHNKKKLFTYFERFENYNYAVSKSSSVSKVSSIRLKGNLIEYFSFDSAPNY